MVLALAEDADEEIRHRARQTLENWNSGELSRVVSDPALPRSVLDSVLRSPALAREELIEAVFHNPAFFAAHKPAPTPAAPGVEPSADSAQPSGPDVPEGAESVLQKVARMSASEKIHAALMGNSEERLILIHDSNLTVARAVLLSPKLSERELEAFAAMKNVAEEVLRALATKRAFVRHYPVVRALANNARAPIDVVLPLLPRLNDRDLRGLAVNRNVADVVRQTAARRFQAKL